MDLKHVLDSISFSSSKDIRYALYYLDEKISALESDEDVSDLRDILYDLSNEDSDRQITSPH